MASRKKDAQLINELEGFIQNTITNLNPEPTKTRGQPRVLPALALWSGILVAVIRGFNAQLEIWRLLSQQGLWDFPRFTIGDDAVYKRLKLASADTLKIVFEQVTLLLTLNFKAPVQSLASFAKGVFALDEMTLDQVKKRLPNLRGSDTAVLLGTITALFDVRRQLWHKLEFHENTLQNEKIAARGMLEFIPVGSLILADLGYFAFAWFDELTTRGYYWISRMRAKTSYTLIHTLFERDGILDAIVWLGAYRADKAGQAVRLVQFTKNGNTWRYVTNVLDPKVLSIREISLLYARRWDIEMMFNLVKTHLKLHWLWSSHLSVVLHQVFAVFTVAQVILATRAEIASRANADVFDVSLDLMIRWLPRFASDGVDPIEVLAERGWAMKLIRASTRMKWIAEELGLEGYSFLPSGTVLVRESRYARKV
jgi:hypothetical protein